MLKKCLNPDCPSPNKEFEPREDRLETQICCDRDCYLEYIHINHIKTITKDVPVVCQNPSCPKPNKIFYVTADRAKDNPKYCEDECYYQARDNGKFEVNFKCHLESCGKDNKRIYNITEKKQFEKSAHHFCNVDCRVAFFKKERLVQMQIKRKERWSDPEKNKLDGEKISNSLLNSDKFHESLKVRQTSEYKNMMRDSINKAYSEGKIREGVSAANKRIFADPIKGPERMVAMARGSIGMSKPEKVVNAHLLEINAPFIYTGSGPNSLVINKKRPDWHNEQYKAIILEHGCARHGCPICYIGSARTSFIEDNYKNTLATTAMYRASGYKVLEIWEHELRDEEWKQKIANFIKEIKNG